MSAPPESGLHLIWRGQLELNVVGVAKGQDRDAEWREIGYLAMRHVVVVEHLDCTQQVVAAGHAERQMVEPDTLLIEAGIGGVSGWAGPIPSISVPLLRIRFGSAMAII
jgi:hypothetical protein